MIKNLYLLLSCILFSSPLIGMKNSSKFKKEIISQKSPIPKKFGKNVFAYQRIANNRDNFNRQRTIESRFIDKEGKLWQKVINIKGTYDIVPVVVGKNGEWVPEKQGKVAATWNHFKKLLGLKTEYPNQVRTPPFGYFSGKLYGEKKIYKPRSPFPSVYAR